jgi:hypothetical protein
MYVVSFLKKMNLDSGHSCAPDTFSIFIFTRLSLLTNNILCYIVLSLTSKSDTGFFCFSLSREISCIYITQKVLMQNLVPYFAVLRYTSTTKKKGLHVPGELLPQVYHMLKRQSEMLASKP